MSHWGVGGWVCHLESPPTGIWVLFSSGLGPNQNYSQATCETSKKSLRKAETISMKLNWAGDRLNICLKNKPLDNIRMRKSETNISDISGFWQRQPHRKKTCFFEFLYNLYYIYFYLVIIMDWIALVLQFSLANISIFDHTTLRKKRAQS